MLQEDVTMYALLAKEMSLPTTATVTTAPDKPNNITNGTTR